MRSHTIISRHDFISLGLAFGKTKRIKKIHSPLSLEEKQKYLDEGQRFAETLANEIGNKEGKCLYHFVVNAKLCFRLYLE